MDREVMEGALMALSAELAARGVTARIYLVGGAVMVLSFNARLSTNDIDAAVHPAEEVLALARALSSRLGLPEDWLNDAAKAFIPVFKEPDWRPVFRTGAIEIAAADERSMLAMKMRASRGRRDQSDIELLLRACHIDTEVEALDLYDQYFPDDPLRPQAIPMLRHALGVNNARRGPPTS